MIARAEWFGPRLFGWGVRPRTWQGWAYILAMLVLVAVAELLPIDAIMKLALILLVIGFVIVDIMMVMFKVYAKLDEREQKHQLMAERNASFVAMASLTVVIVYSITMFAIQLKQHPDPNAVLAQLGPAPLLAVAVVLLMALAKGGTLLWLERKS